MDYTSQSPIFQSVSDHRTQTDRANGLRFAQKYGDIVRFVPTWKSFIVWAGTHWQIDEGNVAVERMAKRVSDEIWDEIPITRTQDFIRHAQRTSSMPGMRAMLEMAKSDLVTLPDAFDRDLWSFNCRSGTIDLRTARIRPHCPKDLILKISDVEFNPDAPCPRFQKFLVEVFHSPELVRFVQRLAGYALTGNVSEQVLVIAHGDGANGKSTLLNAFLHVWGAYAEQAPSHLLIAKNGEVHPTETATLFGRRLVLATETESGGRFSESLVKQLTGGDQISTRRLYEDFWTFSPTHKLVMTTNHVPEFRGTDHGIRRRMLLLPFSRTFSGSDIDPELPEKLAGEADGILAWAVEGCLMWQREGLTPPTEVLAATADFVNSQDVIGRFFDECCELSAARQSKYAELYHELEQFCKDSGDRQPTQKEFSRRLKALGCQDRQSGGRWYDGIGLNNLDRLES